MRRREVKSYAAELVMRTSKAADRAPLRTDAGQSRERVPLRSLGRPHPTKARRLTWTVYSQALGRPQCTPLLPSELLTRSNSCCSCRGCSCCWLAPPPAVASCSALRRAECALPPNDSAAVA